MSVLPRLSILSRGLVLAIAAAALVFLAAPAEAAPAWGNNCLSCHSEWQPDAVYITSEDGLADPDESTTGAPDRGTLPVFEVIPGDTKTLQVTVAGLSTDDAYAVQLTRMRFPGVETAGGLSYTGDCDWPEWGEQANYFTEPVIRRLWTTGPAVFEFDIDVHQGSDYDYYDLIFAVAGKATGTGALFYSEEHFYLQTLVIPGDLDENGTVDLTDYAGFQDCLTGPDNEDRPPTCTEPNFANSKLDSDADVDLRDYATLQDRFTD